MSIPSPTYFKVLQESGECYHGGQGAWPLPAADGPGDWLPKLTGEIVPCQYGYHILRPEDVVYWPGPALFIVETQAETIPHASADGTDSKLVTAGPVRLVSRVETWNDRTLRLFAADCAEYVLPIFERDSPNDQRPRNALSLIHI